MELGHPSTLFSSLRGTLSLHLLLGIILQQGISMVQQFQITQTPNLVTAKPGKKVSLNCIINMEKVGPVVWKKHSGNNSQLFYSDILHQNGEADPRVAWIHTVRILDQSIQITNISVEDAGVYYCVKLNSYKMVYRTGSGVTLTIIARPSHPQITVDRFPRDEDDNSIKLTCTSHGFSPHHIMVTWLKDKNRLLPSQSFVDSQNGNFSFNLTSTVAIHPQKEDIRSTMYCVINHTALQIPLIEVFHLGSIIQVQPKLSLDSIHKVLVNTSVRLNCRALEFYPMNVSVQWSRNGTPIPALHGPLLNNNDGTYSISTFLEVNATEKDNNSTFTCQVFHKLRKQTITTTLLVYEESVRENRLKGIHVAVICIVVMCVLAFTAISFICYRSHSESPLDKVAHFQRRPKKENSTKYCEHHPDGRSQMSAASFAEPGQTDNEEGIKYVELDLTRKQAVKKHIPSDNSSEYACPTTSVTPSAHDSHIMYAELAQPSKSKGRKAQSKATVHDSRYFKNRMKQLTLVSK